MSYKRIFFFLFLFASISLFSQSSIDFGVKGGINYNSNGNLVAVSDFDSRLIFVEDARGRVGYHFGFWARKEFSNSQFYVQPEVVYASTKSTYVDFGRVDYTLQNINVPVLLGKKLLKGVHVFAGPSFLFNIDSDFEDTNNITTDAFGFAFNAGINVEVGKFGVDVRWERGLSKTETEMFNGMITIDSRPNQLIAGLYYKIL